MVNMRCHRWQKTELATKTSVFVLWKALRSPEPVWPPPFGFHEQIRAGVCWTEAGISMGVAGGSSGELLLETQTVLTMSGGSLAMTCLIDSSSFLILSSFR